jgi:very-short-patch-repair endonuclease
MACSSHGLSIAPGTSALTEQVQQAGQSIARTVSDSGITEISQRLSAGWPDGFVDGGWIADASMAAILRRCEEVLATLPKLQEWIVLQHTLQRCSELGLTRFIDAHGSISARHAPGAFQRRFYLAWANAALQLSPALTVFAGVRREEQVARFREIDKKISHAVLSRIKATASEHARRVNAARDIPGAESEVALLRRELEKRKRLKPLRKLFAEIPNVLQALKPCMLMSPLSVSTFFKPGTVSFDLIVFDEASQLPPQEAIPAILRAKQVVVAGDEKQLPPTSFFDTSTIFDEAVEEGTEAEGLEPLESLLDQCVAAFPFFDRSHLRWHYRSKDERLINFSNHFFYRDKPLITFPSVSKSTLDRGIGLVYLPDGTWDRGGSRTNRVEARRIAQLVIQQLEQFPDRSLGIVAMNVMQREAIMEALDEAMLSRPDLQPFLDMNRAEPFFIKSLENVQGDERDTIIISVGYGKSPTGALTFNFGPLNQEGGWRRLNVLVTRSRWQTILVTSLRSQELGGINPNNRGAVELRNFIAYAERDGELPPQPAFLTEEETNDFEDAVAEVLRDRGIEVDQQVGASEYRIDMAIRDPRDRNRYILGVECDGATYHSARTARDRDLLRQEILHEQGWRLYRIWSTDWFRDREKAISGLLRAVEKALATPVEESVQASPRSSSQHSGSIPANEVSSTNEPTKDQRGSTARRFRAGVRYEKFSGKGNRTLLLEPDEVRRLANQIVTIVNFEGPIHIDMLSERLKELNGVARAGANILDNVRRAIEIAVRSAQLERMDGDFLKRKGHIVDTFRIAGDGVERPLSYVPPEEIRVAVLYIVEDQFGYQREALPRAVSKLLGFDRTAEGTAEIVGTIVDDLIEQGALAVSGPNVYLR